MDTEPGAKMTPERTDGKYQIAVGILMVLIIGSLAALWVMERNRRVKAEKNLAKQRQRSPLQAALQQMAASQIPIGRDGAEPTAAGLLREDILCVEKVKWEGRARALVRINASAGRRLGFQPGDLVDVAQKPATMPAAKKGR